MNPQWHIFPAKLALATLVWAFFDTAQACAHGSPIYVSVNTATNQVEVSGSFDDAVIGGSLDSDIPGIGVASENSGIAAGKTIRLRISQGLLFSNSESLQPTTASVTILSAQFPQSLVVTQTSGIQEHLDWAVYPANAGILWDLDGLFELSPVSAAQGVYGLVAQVLLDGAIDSEPFLIPVLHNPTDAENSKAILRQSVLFPSSADFTRDWHVDAEDLAVWKTHFGLSSQASTKIFGDADDDLDVDGADFLRWQREFDGTPSAPNPQSLPVPEPASALLLCIAFFIRTAYSVR